MKWLSNRAFLNQQECQGEMAADSHVLLRTRSNVEMATFKLKGRPGSFFGTIRTSAHIIPFASSCTLQVKMKNGGNRSQRQKSVHDIHECDKSEKSVVPDKNMVAVSSPKDCQCKSRHLDEDGSMWMPYGCRPGYKLAILQLRVGGDCTTVTLRR